LRVCSRGRGRYGTKVKLLRKGIFRKENLRFSFQMNRVK
jgi:hypothetical protein